MKSNCDTDKNLIAHYIVTEHHNRKSRDTYYNTRLLDAPVRENRISIPIFGDVKLSTSEYNFAITNDTVTINIYVFSTITRIKAFTIINETGYSELKQQIREIATR